MRRGTYQVNKQGGRAVLKVRIGEARAPLTSFGIVSTPCEDYMTRPKRRKQRRRRPCTVHAHWHAGGHLHLDGAACKAKAQNEERVIGKSFPWPVQPLERIVHLPSAVQSVAPAPPSPPTPSTPLSSYT